MERKEIVQCNGWLFAATRQRVDPVTLEIVRNGMHFRCALNDGPPVSGHRPSVDVLFRSVAEACGAGAVGVILTGMGNDGARAMAQLKARGGRTIAESQETAVVFGMPHADVGEEVMAVVVVDGDLRPSRSPRAVVSVEVRPGF